jgi:predicted Zn-dependent protease
VELARQHSFPAESAPEAEMLIQAWKRLGLTDVAIDFARQQLASYAYYPGIWTALADLLVQTQNWDELSSLALELRESRLRESYIGWSQYLEGISDHHRNRTVAAADQFASAATNSFQDPLLAFSAAAEMGRLGYPGPSTTLLKSLQSRFADSTTFWAFLQRSAYEARQGDIILEASEQLHLMQPTNAVAANNFAAALLTKRVRPDEALKITEGLYRRFSRSPAVRINQASALIRNARLDEAFPVLQSLEGVEMSESEMTFTRLAWFEYFDARGESERALVEARKVEKRFLFQDQQEWLAGRIAKLDGR